MRGVGHEVAAERLETAQLGHVDEDEQQPLIVARQRSGLHEEPAGLEARELDLDGWIVGRLARLVHDGIELRVPHGLDQELADRVGPEQKGRSKRGVHEDDPPVAIDHDDALVHRLEDAPLQVALRAQFAQGGRKACREPVERLAQPGQLVLPRQARTDLQVPFRHPARRVRQLADGGGHSPGEHVRQDQRQPQSDAGAEPDEAAHVALGRVDLGERLRDAHDAGHRAVAQKGHGGVDQRPVEGHAHVRPVALAGRERLLHLRARGVVLHALHVAERDRRIPEYSAVDPDDRHPRARGAPEFVGERVPGGNVVRQRRGEPRSLPRDEARAIADAALHRRREPAGDRGRQVDLGHDGRRRDERDRDEQQLGPDPECHMPSAKSRLARAVDRGFAR